MCAHTTVYKEYSVIFVTFMARIIKSILSLLLIVVLHVAVSNILVKETLCESSIVLSTSSRQLSFDNIQLPCLPDAELGSIGSFYQQAASRTYRSYFDGSAFSLRDIVRIMAEHEAMLFKHWQKECDGLLSSITHPISEYYVFGLRHIII